MSEHTPGPWRVEQDTTLIWGKCDPEDRSTFGMGYPIAEARVMFGHGSPFCRSARHDEAEANARLIAAAPDMLAVLKKVRETDDAYDIGFSEQERDALHDAIAKATNA